MRCAQKKRGETGFLTPVLGDNGKPKVMVPEALVGMFLEMLTGSKLTPKGGLTKLLAAHEARVAALMAAGSTDTGHKKKKTSSAKHPVAARKGAAKATAVQKAKSPKSPKAGKEAELPVAWPVAVFQSTQVTVERIQ